MVKYIATLLATSLVFSSNNPPCNLSVVFNAAINGTFYCSRSGRLAGLVWWDGKEISPLPVSGRGGLVCWKSGEVEAGYFTSSQTFNGKKVSPQDVRWALTGGGIFLLDGVALSSKEVARKEKLSSYIVSHKSYAFILVTKDRKHIVLGVSKSEIPPAALAKRLQGKYYAMMRLDGGSATCYFFNKKKPHWVNNAVGVTKTHQSNNLKR